MGRSRKLPLTLTLKSRSQSPGKEIYVMSDRHRSSTAAHLSDHKLLRQKTNNCVSCVPQENLRPKKFDHWNKMIRGSYNLCKSERQQNFPLSRFSVAPFLAKTKIARAVMLTLRSISMVRMRWDCLFRLLFRLTLWGTPRYECPSSEEQLVACGHASCLPSNCRKQRIRGEKI